MRLSQRSPIRWSADEHQHIPHGSDWYWALGVIAVATSLTAIIFGDVLFAIVIVVAAVTLGLVARTPPRHMTFELSERGVKVGETLHRYKEIISFWVTHDETGEPPLLLIDTTKFMSPNLIIPLEGVSENSVRAYLTERVPEVEMHESVAHKILEFFGF